MTQQPPRPTMPLPALPLPRGYCRECRNHPLDCDCPMSLRPPAPTHLPGGSNHDAGAVTPQGRREGMPGARTPADPPGYWDTHGDAALRGAL